MSPSLQYLIPLGIFKQDVGCIRHNVSGVYLTKELLIEGTLTNILQDPVDFMKWNADIYCGSLCALAFRELSANHNAHLQW